jgi:sec-independent protein translocase protein TatC
MAKRLRPIGHEDRLSVVDHLDELRSRLIVCAAVLIVAFGVCFWQSSRLLHILNRPLPAQNQNQSNKIGGLAKDNVSTGQHLQRIGSDLSKLAALPNSGLSAQARGLLSSTAAEATNAGKALPASTPKTQLPVTLGVGEPFTVSLTVAFYAALLISLPLLLYELYAFIIPALRPEEKRVARPIVYVAPVLFLAGAVFTYFIVLPAAVKFLNGYNSTHFQNLVQAKPLYTFEVMTMAAIGLAFEMPLFLLGLRAAGVINGRTLTTHWRYAVVIIAVIAAAMPGADPVTTGLETAPLVVLFLASIVLLRLADRRDARRAAAELQRHPLGLGPDDD